ncbi:hypothetical protein JW859_01825 [bacterium]|nr:hypothetical protein [bacterium]
MANARIVSLLTVGLLVLAGTLAWAADFTQTERSFDFNRDCRRQDNKMNAYFGDIMQPGASFHHLGAFKAVIHRDGLDRTLQLVPIKCLPFADADALRASARGNPLAVGALTIAYPQTDADIAPGTFILLFDGYRVRIVDVHEYILNKYKVDLQPAPADAPLDEALGTVTGTAYSQAQITPEGDLILYLQLSEDGDEALMDESGFTKLMLSFRVPGIATDDDSPYRELAEPEEED